MGETYMARAKTTLKDIKPKSTKPDIKIICTECGQEKNAKKNSKKNGK